MSTDTERLREALTFFQEQGHDTMALSTDHVGELLEEIERLRHRAAHLEYWIVEAATATSAACTDLMNAIEQEGMS